MLDIIRRALLLFALTLSVIPLGAQRIPSSLSNPATPELEYSYGKAYKNYKSSYYLFGSGVGIAALGYGLIKHTENRIEMNPDPSGLNEAAGMVIVFEGMLAGTGLLISAGGVGLNLWSRSRINRLNMQNDFLNTPGEDLDSWKRYRVSRVYDSSKKWMKASGITTCCLAGYTLAGAIGCCYSDSNFLLTSAETAMWLSFASGASFLVSWAVNSSAMHNLYVLPSMTFIPSTEIPFAGLSLTAKF